DLLVRQQALVEELEPVAAPANRFDCAFCPPVKGGVSRRRTGGFRFLHRNSPALRGTPLIRGATPSRHTTRSLPPSTGTWAAVVFAKSGPHISAASSATSFDESSVRSKLFFLYCSTLMLYAFDRAASTSSVQSAVSNTWFGCSVLMRMPSFAHSSAATRASWLSAALEAE